MKVTLSADGIVKVDDVAVHAPPLTALRPYLAQRIRGRFLQQAILNGKLTRAEAVLALQRYYFVQRTQSVMEGPDGAFTIETDHALQPMYMAVGATLYALHPVREVSVNKALTTMRQTITDHVQAEATAIREIAASQAMAVRSEASSLLAQAERRVRQQTPAITTRPPLPEGLFSGGYSVTIQSGNRRQLYVLASLGLQITHAEIRGHTFPLDSVYRRLYPVHIVLVWNELVQKWVYSSIGLAPDARFNLPHLGKSIACLTAGDRLDGAPIETGVAVQALVRRVSEILNTINFNSLLTEPSTWDMDLRLCIPAQFFEDNGNRDVLDMAWVNSLPHLTPDLNDTFQVHGVAPPESEVETYPELEQEPEPEEDNEQPF